MVSGTDLGFEGIHYGAIDDLLGQIGFSFQCCRVLEKFDGPVCRQVFFTGNADKLDLRFDQIGGLTNL